MDPNVTLLTYNLLSKQAAIVPAEEHSTWNKSSTALGVIQGKINLAIWPEFINHMTVATLWTTLETKYGKAREATTYLQVVSLYKVHMMDSSPLLPQIQNFQKNHTWILMSRHLKLSEDIATFIFCSSLPLSYQDLTLQYLTSIENITKYNLQKIIASIIKEESQRKAQTNAVAGGS